MPERRKFSRIIYKTPATLTQRDGSWQSEIRDLSLNGVLMSRPVDWHEVEENDYYVSFTLLGSDIQLNMEVDLVSESDHHLHFHINHIDIDSASHLKRLVELNVGNDNLLHRELAQLSDLDSSI